ncbi:MAG: N(4)-(beta-N-acetylglucosaminyl)-L-asparaginase [Planctomycetota bacterium]|nr:N(4)-(beta-N-acetylglucosaminyl)-L-asparaginase [Planctomycetota bacterium]
MKSALSRRRFLGAGAAAAAAAAVPAATNLEAIEPAPPAKPVSISSANGLAATARAVKLMDAKDDTLEAVISGVNIVEADPKDMSVGYGGLPNEDGIVELDSCCMHGPSSNAGSVASIRDIKLPSRVAQLVLKRTDHVMLVGEGARRFALAHGMKAENLLTDAARRKWLKWKENLSDKDDWLSPKEAETGHEARPTGTITCLGLNPAGELSGVTSTSGLAYKIPGRIGDSPIIGAGLYVDNDVGACGATGRGEAVIISCGSRIVVENMRHGMSPEAAVKDVLKRIVKQTVDPRLLDKKGRPDFEVVLYALHKDGRHAAGSIYKGRQYAVNEGGESKLLDCVHLLDR